MVGVGTVASRNRARHPPGGSILMRGMHYQERPVGTDQRSARCSA